MLINCASATKSRKNTTKLHVPKTKNSQNDAVQGFGDFGSDPGGNVDWCRVRHDRTWNHVFLLAIQSFINPLW